MKYILFGGPSQKSGEKPNIPTGEYLDLVRKLESHGCQVVYFNPADPALFSVALLADNESPWNPHRRDLIICDTSLICARNWQEPDFAPNFVEFISTHRAPKLVLADLEVAETLMPFTRKAGYSQINKPLNLDEVVGIVNSLVK